MTPAEIASELTTPDTPARAELRRRITRLLRLPVGARVIELGAASGLGRHLARELSAQIVLVDELPGLTALDDLGAGACDAAVCDGETDRFGGSARLLQLVRDKLADHAGAAFTALCRTRHGLSPEIEAAFGDVPWPREHLLSLSAEGFEPITSEAVSPELLVSELEHRAARAAEIASRPNAPAELVAAAEAERARGRLAREAAAELTLALFVGRKLPPSGKSASYHRAPRE